MKQRRSFLKELHGQPVLACSVKVHAIGLLAGRVKKLKIITEYDGQTILRVTGEPLLYGQRTIVRVPVLLIITTRGMVILMLVQGGEYGQSDECMKNRRRVECEKIQVTSTFGE